MRRLIILALVVIFTVPARAYAQQLQDSTTDSIATPPPPTPKQERYLRGLRTAGRGVAQIKNGISRVVRAHSAGDTSRVHQAGLRLSGLCQAARRFIVSGRSQMALNAYEMPIRKPARALAFRLDSLAAFTRTCQHQAGKTPEATSTEMLKRVRDYEEALADFRTAIGLPNR